MNSNNSVRKSARPLKPTFRNDDWNITINVKRKVTESIDKTSTDQSNNQRSQVTINENKKSTNSTKKSIRSTIDSTNKSLKLTDKSTKSFDDEKSSSLSDVSSIASSIVSIPSIKKRGRPRKSLNLNDKSTAVSKDETATSIDRSMRSKSVELNNATNNGSNNTSDNTLNNTSNKSVKSKRSIKATRSNIKTNKRSKDDLIENDEKSDSLSVVSTLSSKSSTANITSIKQGRGRPKKDQINSSSKSIRTKMIKSSIKVINKKKSTYVKKKNRIDVVDDVSEFKCSVCDLIFHKRTTAQNHVLTVHNGLARLNDTNNNFNESEILAAYKAAIGVLKTLHCKKCNKSFTTPLGLKFHDEICGKSDEEVKRKCELCGNMLKFMSMKSHLEMHKRREERMQQMVSKQNMDNENLTETSSTTSRPIRSSAKRANEFLKSSADFDDDSDGDQNRKKKRKKSYDDENYDLSTGGDDDDDNYEDEENDSEPLIRRNRPSSKKVSSSFRDQNVNLASFQEAERFHKKHFNETAFKDWIFDERSISFLNQNKLQSYLPELKCSVKFKTKILKDDSKRPKNNCKNSVDDNKNDEDQESNEKNLENDDNPTMNNRIINENIDNNHQNQSSILESDWTTLDLFESQINRHHITFYTGGPVYSASWCPFPLDNENVDQIICLSTDTKSRTFNVFDCDQTAGCLQFWNFGKLKINQKHDENTELRKPKLEFLIAHNYGTITEIIWCPGGTSYCPANKRLGLLALACTDGFIRILNIPLIEEINRLSTKDDIIKVIKLEPIVILDRHPICSSVFNKATICKTISWSQTDQQRFIVAGYGNGLISIFDLQTQSSLLKKVNTTTDQIFLKPKKNWIAHSACVTSVKWIPLAGCLHIVSGGFDRVVKVWSLDDMITNINLPKKSVITNVHWTSRYVGCFYSWDDCYTNFHNNVTYRDLTQSSFMNSLSRHKTCVWDFDLSNWTSTQIGVDSSGEVILSVYVRPKNGKKYSKSRPYECLPIYRLTYESLDAQNDQQQNPAQKLMINTKRPINSINYLIEHDKPMKRTLDEMMDSYGIVFNEVDLTRYSTIPIREFERLKIPETMNYPRLGDYPLVSLNKVQYNPNRSSRNYVFTGGESGLSRVSCIEFLKNPFFGL